MGSIIWDREVAEVYDQTYRAKFEPSVLDPMVDLLAGLAAQGPLGRLGQNAFHLRQPEPGRGVREERLSQLAGRVAGTGAS
jgi:hypothetical protein